MSFRHTLNLPQTDFPMKANLPEREPQLLKRWNDQQLYASIRRARRNQSTYVLHDGPPYANGDIHLGHVLNKVLKDIVVKYHTMRGYDSPFVPGWDCHGMPIEHKLLSELGQSKADVEPVSFRQRAREYALRYVSVQREQFQRLGIFGRWEEPYLTLSKDYEASIVEAFVRMLREGYIYRGERPVNWCATCETALADAEVEYQDHQSPSIVVAFPARTSKLFDGVPEDARLSVLVWTTTPWTLVSNVAVAMHPDLDYALVRVSASSGDDREDQWWLLASARLDALRGEADVSASTCEEVMRHPGRWWVESSGLSVEHLWIEDRHPRLVLADFVSADDGTGCVHIAPGHGEIDYEVGGREGLPTIMPVTAQGTFDQTAGGYAGLSILEANDRIIQDVRASGRLVASSALQHSYPHCWRCHDPLIFRATPQWFIGVDRETLRARAMKAIDQVQWIPSMGQQRITAMVAERPDWCLSRQRFWGVPIPIVYCTSCGEALVDDAVLDRAVSLVKQQGSDAWLTEGVESLVGSATCAACSGTTFRREEDVLDVWFDSGVSHLAVLDRDTDLGRPADMYLEGSDQHRGWFQASLIASVALANAAPFRAVLTHGFVVDGDGKKMSKSAGNVISPVEVLQQHGADILRLWVASSDYQGDIRISDEIIDRTVEAYRKLRNTAKFLLGNVADFDPNLHRVAWSEMQAMDRWALLQTGQLIQQATTAYEQCRFHTVYRLLYDFCTGTLSSFYLDALKDRLYTFEAFGQPRRSAQTALYEVVQALARLLGPIVPFTAEEIWRHVPGMDPDVPSVHLADWPVADPAWQDETLEQEWGILLGVRAQVLKVLEEQRQSGLIGTSLEAAVELYPAGDTMARVLERYRQTLPEVLIVSSVGVHATTESNGALGVTVTRAVGSKCERCWMYLETVGEVSEWATLCHRCRPVVDALGTSGASTAVGTSE